MKGKRTSLGKEKTIQILKESVKFLQNYGKTEPTATGRPVSWEDRREELVNKAKVNLRKAEQGLLECTVPSFVLNKGFKLM